MIFCCQYHFPNQLDDPLLVQSTKEKKEQIRFNYESKGEHLNFDIFSMWIRLLDKL